MKTQSRNTRLFAFGVALLSIASVGKANAIPVTLTVNTNTDNPPGGQTISSGATTGDLRYCINYILNQQAQGVSQDYVIQFAPGVDSIQLSGKLSMVNLLGSDTITIGNPDPAPAVTITGSSGTCGLFIRQGTVTLQNINFENCNATGGSGGPGGGGGMGAGGALFIDTADVTLHNVNFSGCSATAGIGSSGSGGGGGGLGGNGGNASYGAGGGYAGNGGGSYGGGGGAGGDGGSNLGGGGGAILGTTGGSGGSLPTDAVTITPSGSSTPFVVGGGSYGSNGNTIGGTGAGGNNSGGLGGSDGGTNIGGNGGDGGSPNPAAGGAGANTYPNPGSSGDMGSLGGNGGSGGGYLNDSSTAIGSGGGGGGGYSGGGGGGGCGNFGSNNYGGGGGGGGGLGGGGGGGFGANGGSGASGSGGGGNSSIGGGGGGGGSGGGGGGCGFGLNGLGSGGNGGDGGGGGGCYDGGAGGYGAGSGNGASGGFGGGGGNDDNGGFGGGAGSNGMGGFGGGGGSGSGMGGTGATNGTSQGGNGAALGGAVFLGSSNGQPTLTLTGNCSTSSNSTSNNMGSSFAGGNDFFLYSGTTLNLVPGAGETISISQSIIDDSVQSIPMSSNWVAGSGMGSNLQVTGTGTVTLSGSNSYIGTTTVSSGILNLVNSTLYAGGMVVGSQVTVSSGATLKGTGTINAPTNVSGTLSPGNSIGTLSFTAPLTLPGILSIEIAPTAGDNSQISSTSTVDVTGATIQIVADPGTYTAGTQYTLLTSTGLRGAPSLLMPPFFLGQLSYLNNSILLTLLNIPHSTLQLNGLKGNNLKLAKYLNTLGIAALGAPFETLVNLPENDQADALLTLSPSRAAFPRYGNIQTALSFSRLVTQRLGNARILREKSTPPIVSSADHLIDPTKLIATIDFASVYRRKWNESNVQPVDKKPYNVWISGFGGWLYEGAGHQNPAFHATDSGVLAAADKTFDNDVIVGGGLAYANSHIHETHRFGKANSQGGFATLYGTWFFSDFFLDASLWCGYLRTHNQRNIFYPGFAATASSRYNSVEADGHFELGYDWFWGQGTLEPFVAFDFIGNWQGNYSERGAAPFNMRIKSNFASLLQTEAGFNGYYSRNFLHWTFILRGKLSYVNQVPFHQGSIQAYLIGAPNSLGLVTSLRMQNLVSPALELYWKHQCGLFFSLGYNGQFGSEFRNNELEATLGFNF